jgi:uncharacterized protein
MDDFHDMLRRMTGDRFLSTQLAAGLRKWPAVLLQGARRVGKTQLAKAIDPARRYLALEDVAVYAQASLDAAAFVNSLHESVTIDDTHRVPGLLEAVLASVERDGRAGRFLLVSAIDLSSSLPALSTVSERLGVVTLWPLSAGEVPARPVDDAGRRSFVDRFFASRFSAGDHDTPDWARLVESLARRCALVRVCNSG